MTGRDKVKKYELIIKIVCMFFYIIPSNINLVIYNCLKRGENKLVLLLRYAILKNICKSVGENVYIGEFVTIKHPENIVIGDNVSIQKYCYLDGLGGIEIGNDVSIATDVKLFSFNHTWNDQNRSIKYNELSLNKIKISSDVWIGCQSCILAGVSVGTRVVVGAGSVVTKDLKSNSVYAGNPAKLIKRIGE